MYQLGWFSTGRDKAARDLLVTVQNSIQAGVIEAEIAFVFSNREPGESAESDQFFKLVEGYHIPLVHLSYSKFKASQQPTSGNTETLPQWRMDYDKKVMARLEDFTSHLAVLVGYMLIVGPEMCRRYDMINLHPAAPGGPAGTWQEVIWQLIENDADETGVMVHLVTPELDKGPPVTYGTFPIKGEPFDRYWDEIKGWTTERIKNSQGENNRLFRLIREHGFTRELPLIIATIKAFSQGKVIITADKQVTDIDGRPVNGYNLSDEINEVVEARLSG